jgi:hypothetical protein
VVADIDGVVYDAPVPRLDPPVDAAYQLMVPPLEVAPKVTVPVPHIAAGVDPIIVGAEALTVAVTAVLDAVIHVPLVAST